jgi:hypothetical protein
MRLDWSGVRRPPVPADVAAAIAPEDGDKLLAWGHDGQGTTAVAGRHRLHVVTAGEDGALAHVLDRPWHLVDAGTWNGEDVSLRVTWVDRHPPTRLVLTEPGMFPQVLRERVQASVVLAESLDLGPGRTARVAVRRVLSSGELVSQAILGPGVRLEDAGVRDEVMAALAGIREQVGLD